MQASTLAAISSRQSYYSATRQPAIGCRARTATLSDVHGIERLLSLAGPGCIALSADVIRARLHNFYIAENQNGFIWGCLSLVARDESTASLQSVAVDSRVQGLGLGTFLVRETLLRAPPHYRYVRCTTRHPAFYEALGFVKTQEPPAPLEAQAVCGSEERARVVMSLDLSLPTHATALRRASHLRLI